MCFTVNLAATLLKMSGKICFFDRLKMRITFCLFFLFNGFLIDYNNAYNCCYLLNPGNTRSTDCACSDQTGGVGTCSCTTSPNTRQGWLCKKDTNGDSVK